MSNAPLRETCVNERLKAEFTYMDALRSAKRHAFMAEDLGSDIEDATLEASLALAFATIAIAMR